MSRTKNETFTRKKVNDIRSAAKKVPKVVRDKKVRAAGSAISGRSKLDPFLTTIKGLKKQKGFNNQQVSEFLTEHGVTASLGLVNGFCTRHGLSIRINE